jgi:hypothetical protein
MGRAGFFDEVMRFYDQFLKGVAPTVQDPPIAVQTNDGKWRAEASWPPSDATRYTSPLRAGSYTDDGSGNATQTSDTAGVWTISPRLPYDAHMSGSGTAVVDVATTRPNANLVVDVYDLDEYGIGPLITRQGFLARSSGEKTLDLWSADWKLAAGHRIGVRVVDNNQDWWLFASPTGQTVSVRGGSITLPFLRYRRTATIQGDKGVQLDGYLGNTITVQADKFGSSQVGFSLPPALADPPPGSVFTGNFVEPVGSGPSGASGTLGTLTASRSTTTSRQSKRARLAAKLARRGRTFVISGTAPAKTTVTVALLRAGRKVATKRVKASPKGAYRVTFVAHRAGLYRALVTVRSAGRTLTTRTATARLLR